VGDAALSAGTELAIGDADRSRKVAVLHVTSDGATRTDRSGVPAGGADAGMYVVWE